jgi:putative oxidoreductase
MQFVARAERDRFAVFVFRVLLGALFIAHGYPKLLGALHGPGLAGFARSIEGLGFHPGLAWAWAVTLVEFVGGIFVFVGFATRIAAALIAIEMIIAGLLVNVPRGFYWSQGGFEVPLLYAVMAIVLVLTGPGAPSVDRAIGWERSHEDRPTL